MSQTDQAYYRLVRESFLANSKQTIKHLILTGRVDDLLKLEREFQYDYANWMLKFSLRSGNRKLVEHYYQHNLQVPDPIGEAVRYGNHTLVNYLRSLGYCPTELSMAKATSLYTVQYLYSLGVQGTELAIEKSAKHGKLETIRYLISRGVVPISGVVQAAAHGHLDVVEFLVEYGLPVKPTALEAAAGGGHLNVVQYLTQYVRSSEFAVVEASKAGHLEVVKYLIDNGFEADSHAIYLAAQNGHSLVVDYLYDKVEWRPSVLANSAAAGGLLNVLESLGKHSTSKETVELAAEKGHYEVVQWLYILGVRGDSKSLELAASGGHHDIVSYLHKHGIEPTDQSLIYAARSGSVITVEYIYEALDKRLDVITLHDALTVAAEHGHFDIVMKLHEYLKRAGQFRFNNPKAVMGAAKSNSMRILEYLYSAGCRGEHSSMTVATATGYLPAVIFLHEHGVEVRDSDVEMAASRGYLEMVKYFSRIGLPMSTEVMHSAIDGGHVSVVAYLRQQEVSLPERPLKIAANTGRLSVLKYIHSIKLEEVPKIVNWLMHHQRYTHVSIIERLGLSGVREVFRVANERDDQQVVDYLFDKVLDDVQEAIELASRNSHYAVAEYLNSMT